MVLCIFDPELKCQDPDGEIYCEECSYYQAMMESTVKDTSNEEQGKAIII